MTGLLVHATAVAIGGHALLLRGPSGAGKSDLALRVLGVDAAFAWLQTPMQPIRLVSDDQVRLERSGDALMVSPPESIRGLIEVRGLGIVRLPHIDRARLRLVIDLVPQIHVPRMPCEDETVDLLGVPLPRLQLSAFDASAPLKCVLGLRDAISGGPRS